MTLHSAIKKTISDFGYEILFENKRLLNILCDLNAFSDLRLLKSTFEQALESSCFYKIVELGRKTSILNFFRKSKLSAPESDKLQSTVLVLIDELSSVAKVDRSVAGYIIESVRYGLGWSIGEPILPNCSRETVKHFSSIPEEKGITVESIEKELSVKPNKEVQYVVIEFSPSQAIVSVDGRIIQSYNGVAMAEVSLGRHSYQVKADGYDTVKGNFIVDKRNKAQLSAFLVCKPIIISANVSITVQTKGTEIFIDGKSIGFDNCKVELASGPHRIIAKKETYKDYETSISVFSGKSYTVKIPQMWKLTGKLNVKVMPHNSTIFINGNKVGTTPYILTWPVGTVELRVVSANGNIYRKDITIIADKIVDVVFSINDAASS